MPSHTEYSKYELEQIVFLLVALSVLWPYWENKSLVFILEAGQISSELTIFVTTRENKWSVFLSLLCRFNSAPGWIRNTHFVLHMRCSTH